MRKKIIAFGASNSRSSINKKFAQYAASQLRGVSVEVMDLSDFELPVYAVDDEKVNGVPSSAVLFAESIKASDGIVISLAEYNGLYTSAFKNLWDWMSRIATPNVWHNKPMFLIGTSPSRRKGSYVMKVSEYLFPLFGAQIIASYHLPSFNHFFDQGEIIDPLAHQQFKEALQKFQDHLDTTP
ncbi:MAG: NAD(P)H-dependent oxidoreductase [Flavobacteriaceae bacterium]|nr:NAD(P)H-dependent oxidoreductase [Flavobacteriaceae bacterium]